MKWLNIIKTILECLTIIGPIFKITKLEKEVKVLMTGVDRFSKAETSSGKGKILEDTIKAIALETGIEKRFHKKVRKFKARLYEKIF